MGRAASTVEANDSRKAASSGRKAMLDIISSHKKKRGGY
jgi:hypothetical protein